MTGQGAALQKNVSTAAALLGNSNYDGGDLRSRFDAFTVYVHAPRLTEEDRNLLPACHVALNLLARMARVRYSGPEEMLQTLPPQLRRRIAPVGSGREGAAKEASVSIVFGASEVADAPCPLYVGSSGWSAYLSTGGPCMWSPRVHNGMGGALAGALAAGEVFKAMFPEARPEAAVHLEYDLVTHGRAPQPVTRPDIPNVVDLDRVALVGCGAIGQAMCLALRGVRLAGEVVLVDNEKLDESNEQRYVLAHEGTRGGGKASYLASHLAFANPLLKITVAESSYEAYMTEFGRSFEPETVVVCVDNVATRVNVQGILPRVVWNGWTDVARGSLRYGVSRHALGGGDACIACYYYPGEGQPSQMRMNSIMTGLPEGEVRELLSNNAPCTEEIVRRVAGRRGIPEMLLRPNVGRPFGELLHGHCGVFALGTQGGAEPAPAPHQPALAGILLASQIVLSHVAREQPDAGSPLIESASDFDAMRLPGPDCLFRLGRDERCFCGDADYVKAYRKKWVGNGAGYKEGTSGP